MITAPFRKSALPSEQADFHHAGRSTERRAAFPVSQSVGRSLHAPLAYKLQPTMPDRRGKGREGSQAKRERRGEESRPKHFARLPPPSSHRSGDGCLPGESSAQFLGSTTRFGGKIASLCTVSMHKREWTVAIAGVRQMTG